ncbi:MAG: exonuclease SbcCD subunit D [Intestinibacillus sp.]
MLLHLADLHLGASYDFLPDKAATACRAAQLTALTDALHYANDRRADAVLIAGDLFDAPVPPAPLVTQVLSLLSRAHCPVLISPGNHDYLCPESPYESPELPANVHVFRSAQLEPFALDEETLIWGAAFCGTSAAIPLGAPLPEDQCNLLLVHADLLASSGYNPLSPDRLADSGFSYAALGHNHDFSGLLRAGGTVYACPGCLMARAGNETGTRGFLAGSVTREDAALQFIPGSGVVFAELIQSLTGIVDDRALGKAIAAQIPENHHRVCATLTLTGERRYEPDLAALQNALGRVFLSAALRDQSALWRDPWRYAGDDDLRGAVTRRFRAQHDGTADSAVRKQTLYALRVALAALDGEDFPQPTVSDQV